MNAAHERHPDGHAYFMDCLELLEQWADNARGRSFSIIRFSVENKTLARVVGRKGWALNICEGAETLYSAECDDVTRLAQHVELFLVEQGGFDV